MVFDWTISLGNILTVVGFGVAGVIFVMTLRNDTFLLCQRVNAVESVLKELVQGNLEANRQRGRLEMLDERVNVISKRLDGLIAGEIRRN